MAPCHWFAFSQAVMAELVAITFLVAGPKNGCFEKNKITTCCVQLHSWFSWLVVSTPQKNIN